MENFLSTLPGIITSWVALVVLVVGGVFAVIGVFDKKNKERLKEKDEAGDTLINILQETVDKLKERVEEQSKDIETLSEKLDELEKENKTLIKILQGRDEKTQEFYKLAFPAIETINKIYQMTEKVEQRLQVIK